MLRLPLCKTQSLVKYIAYVRTGGHFIAVLNQIISEVCRIQRYGPLLDISTIRMLLVNQKKARQRFTLAPD